jgi:hypothetical protein
MTRNTAVGGAVLRASPTYLEQKHKYRFCQGEKKSKSPIEWKIKGFTPASALPGHKASTRPSAAFQKYKHPILAAAAADAELADADADANDTVPLGAVKADADHAAAIEWHAAADSGAGIKTDSSRADGGEAADGSAADADRDDGRGSSEGKCREKKQRGATRRSDDATSRRR